MRLTGIIAPCYAKYGYLAPGRIAPGRPHPPAAAAVPRPGRPLAGQAQVRPVSAADTNSA